MTTVDTDTDQWSALNLDNPHSYRCINGQWQQDEDGTLSAPENLTHENLLFFVDRVYLDFEAEFEFRLDTLFTTAALLFRAADAQHYYAIDFPVVGQQSRAEHFWATVSTVDKTTWRRGLHMQMVPGVTSTQAYWHKARVVVQGDAIRVWVNGRPVSTVHDTTYPAPGFIGLATYEGYSAKNKSLFRNLRVTGRALPPPAWDDSIQPECRRVIIHPGPAGSCGKNFCRLADGQLVVQSTGRICRSDDNGRTWSLGNEVCDQIRDAMWRHTKAGTLEAYKLNSNPPFTLHKSKSTDGDNWSPMRQVSEFSFPPDQPYEQMYCSAFVELRDGTLLLIGYGRTHYDKVFHRGRMHYHQSAPGYIGFSLRSTDAGETWSPPADLDGPPYHDNQCTLAKDLRNEVAAAQTAEGNIITLARPHDSPTMWESWSYDGGRVWTPTARGAFPLYGGCPMLCTASGVLVIGGRFPGIALQYSRDNGMTWNFYQIDTGAWANGGICEVEPDVVLFAYGRWNDPAQLNAQRIRVTPHGLEPA